MAVKIPGTKFIDTEAIQSTQVASQHLPRLPVYVTTSNWADSGLIPATPLSSCVTSGQQPSFSESVSSSAKMEDHLSQRLF